jgi:uncharacterized protein YceK
MKNLLIAFLVLQLAGCATIFNGSRDQISVRSNEPGTKIYIDEMEVGTDNAIWSVPKKGDHTIRVAKEGCADVSTPIKYSFDATSLLGILLDFGIVSMLLVDGAGTGAISKADQTSYILTPNCSAAARKAVQESRGNASVDNNY